MIWLDASPLGGSPVLALDLDVLASGNTRNNTERNWAMPPERFG